MDGAGRETWGPGPVGEKLYWLSRPASLAFDTAASVVQKMVLELWVSSPSPEEFTEHMRKIAPALLEVVLALEAAHRERDEQFFNNGVALAKMAPVPKGVLYASTPGPKPALFPAVPVQRAALTGAITARHNTAAAYDSDGRFAELVRMARKSNATSEDCIKLAPCPVIAPPLACVSCGDRETLDRSVCVRIDGFPRCDSCESTAAGS